MARVSVRYKGISDERRITARETKGRGVSLGHDLVWSRSNGFKQVIDANDAFVELLKAEGHFTISAVADDGSDGEVVATATDPAGTGDVVKDDTTGATSDGSNRTPSKAAAPPPKKVSQ